jgi:hypothetical protein
MSTTAEPGAKLGVLGRLQPGTTYNVQDWSWVGELTIGKTEANWMHHALERAVDRAIKLPTTIEARPGQVVEVRTDARGNLEVAVARIPYLFDKRKSLVIVWDISQKAVRTAYLNWNHDQHSTLKIKRR